MNPEPRAIKALYDDPAGGGDHYTAVIRRDVYPANPGRWPMIGFNDLPFHPSFGIYQHSEGMYNPRRRNTHLGKRIHWRDLPEDCRAALTAEFNMEGTSDNA